MCTYGELDSMTVKELTSICQSNKQQYAGYANKRKTDLIQHMLSRNTVSVNDHINAQSSNCRHSASKLDAMTVAEMKEYCRDHGYRGYSTLNRAPLIQFILQQHSNPTYRIVNSSDEENTSPNKYKRQSMNRKYNENQLSNMKVVELQQICRDNHYSGFSKYDKAALLQHIIQSTTHKPTATIREGSDSDVDDEGDSESDTETYTEGELQAMTVVQLKQLCRDNDYTGFSKCKLKDELVLFILQRTINSVHKQQSNTTVYNNGYDSEDIKLQSYTHAQLQSHRKSELTAWCDRRKLRTTGTKEALTRRLYGWLHDPQYVFSSDTDTDNDTDTDSDDDIDCTSYGKWRLAEYENHGLQRQRMVRNKSKREIDEVYVKNNNTDAYTGDTPTQVSAKGQAADHIVEIQLFRAAFAYMLDPKNECPRIQVQQSIIENWLFDIVNENENINITNAPLNYAKKDVILGWRKNECASCRDMAKNNGKITGKTWQNIATAIPNSGDWILNQMENGPPSWSDIKLKPRHAIAYIDVLRELSDDLYASLDK